MKLSRTKLLFVAGMVFAGNAFAQIDPGPNPGDTSSVSFSYQNQQVRYKTVRSKDGKVWLQQNLGAQRVALNTKDTLSYGHYFQWGRWDDGHQLKTSTKDVSTSLSSNDPSAIASGSDKFYTGWWVTGLKSDTWTNNPPSKVNGKDPCAAIGPGWRLPTIQDWKDFVAAEAMQDDTAGAIKTTLKLPPAGYRHPNGTMGYTMSEGAYWSTTNSSGVSAHLLQFTSGASPFIIKGTGNFMARDYGFCIRCVKVCQLIDTVAAEICFNKSYVRPNGQVAGESGVYMDIVGATSLKCDSVIITNLVVLPELSQIEIIGEDTICGALDNVFSVGSADGASKYFWNLPAGWLAATDSSAVTVKTDGVEGVYTISVYAANSCGDTSQTASMDIYVSVPQAVITVNERELGVSKSFASYQWYLNDVAIEGATGATYTITENGRYNVRVTDHLGCSDYSENYIVTNIGSSIGGTQQLAQQINIFPNPAADMLYINAPVPLNIVVTSIEGKIIRKETKVVSGISVASFAQGIYLLRIMDTEGNLIKVEKFVKGK